MEQLAGREKLIRNLSKRWMKRYVDLDIDQWMESLTSNLNSMGYDPFGLNPEVVATALPLAYFFYRWYFRTEVKGVENVPDGRVLVVANHSGQLPVDGAIITVALLLERKPPRITRSMMERWVPSIPFVNIFMARCGQVLGTPENCKDLLERDEAILVFPEGVRGVSKTWDRRYQLQEFGYGFMRLALETGTPIVPVGVIGGEEQMPSFYNFRTLARLLGMPAFPITPTFPWLFPIGIVPYPVKYRLYFGKPMRFEGDPNDENQIVGRKVSQVKEAIAEQIRIGLEERGGVFW